LAIAGPNVNGLAIQLLGKNYYAIMILVPIFILVALYPMLGVRRGEVQAA